MNVAIIPARGGSKRIPRKNVLDFNGKPMIWWSIEAARASGCFERVVVSTDDPAIAEVARAGGAETPFLRPAALADDHTPTVPVVMHALEALAADGYVPDAACCLYATAPLVRAGDIRRGREALRDDVDYSVSVTTFAYPVQRALRMDSHGRLEMVDPAMQLVRSQDLEERFHDAAQFYWGWSRAWREGRAIFAGAVLPVLLPRAGVQDIDTPEDFELARALQAAWMAQQP